jgi:hypothetical protein
MQDIAWLRLLVLGPIPEPPSIAQNLWLSSITAAVPMNVRLPWFGPRMICTHCVIIGAFARPNWQEGPTGESLTGRQCWSRCAIQTIPNR